MKREGESNSDAQRVRVQMMKDESFAGMAMHLPRNWRGLMIMPAAGLA